MRWGLVPSYAKTVDEYSSFGGGGRPSTINARVETADQSGMWRRLLDQRRCLVLFDGFYEWKQSKDGKKKTPVFVRHVPAMKEFSIPGGCSDIEVEKAIQQLELEASSPQGTPAASMGANLTGTGLEEGGMPLLLAGLYDVWAPKDGGEPLESVTILTMDPTGTPMEAVHDRMPVFLSERTAEEWLRPPTTSACAPFGQLVGTLLKEAKRVAVEQLQIYEVADLVGNIRNDTPDCLVPRAVVAKRQLENGLGRFFTKKAKTEPADTGSRKEVSKPEDGDHEATQSQAESGVKLPLADSRSQ